MTFQTIIFGLIGMALSGSLVWFAVKLDKAFLHVDYFDRKFGAGGSLNFLRISGIILFFLSILVFFGQLDLFPDGNSSNSNNQEEVKIEIDITPNLFNQDKDPL